MYIYLIDGFGLAVDLLEVAVCLFLDVASEGLIHLCVGGGGGGLHWEL